MLPFSPWSSFTELESLGCGIARHVPNQLISRHLKAYIMIFVAYHTLLFCWIHCKDPTVFNIVCWVDGTPVSLTKNLMFQMFFYLYIIFCNILCKNPFNLFSIFFHNLSKIKMRSFKCHDSMEASNPLFYFQSIN